MRRELYHLDRDAALDLLRRSPVVHLASTAADGSPILRTVHGVIVGNAIAFHGSPVGEKTLAIGRPAVLSAEEIVSTIPSYWVDPERACPATTYYRSVQVHGTVETVTDPKAKAAMLTALMSKYQPEGGHEPITADHPLYRGSVEGLLVLQVSLDLLDGKANLGQGRRASEISRVLQHLWTRGQPGDLRAIDLVVQAHPGAPSPPRCEAPEGIYFTYAPQASDAAEVARVLQAETFWNHDVPVELLERAHLGSSAWIVARAADGGFAGSARAVSDGGTHAGVYDVFVTPSWRGRGLGKALMGLLLDHPAVRHARRVWLSTRDAKRLYARFGFVELHELPPASWSATEMVWLRNAAALPGSPAGSRTIIR